MRATEGASSPLHCHLLIALAGAVCLLQGGGSRGQQQWWPEQGYSLQRALAAAQKRSWLLPDDL
jgi:hypothetical protein